MAIIRRLQPTVTTNVASARVTPGGTAVDRITVGGTEGRPGTIEWSIVGPVPKAADWTCDGVDWNGAPEVDSGTLPTEGDGEYETPPTTLPDEGCFAYVVTVGGEQIGGSANSPAGSPNEVVFVRQDPGSLKVTKEAGRKQVPVGSRVKYTIVVKNDGSGPVPDVKLVDQPDKPMKFVSARASQGTCDAQFPLTCELGTIGAGSEATVTVIAEPLVAGKIPNTATATTPDPEVPPSTDRERITGKVRVELTKVASKRKVKAGERLTYRIKVKNPTVAVASNVKVCDRPPAGLEVITTKPKAKLQKGAYCWRIKRIPARGSVTLKVIARTLAGAKGKLTNVAWAEGQDVITSRDRTPIRVTGAKSRPGGVTG